MSEIGRVIPGVYIPPSLPEGKGIQAKKRGLTPSPPGGEGWGVGLRGECSQ